MQQNKIQINQEDLAKAFFYEIDERYDSVLEIIKSLNNEPNDIDEINNLFREVHSTKGDLQVINLHDVANFLHAVEDILEYLRAGKMEYTPKLGKLVQLALEETITAAEHAVAGSPVSAELKYIVNIFKTVCQEDENARNEAINISISLLNPFHDAQEQQEQKVEESEEVSSDGRVLKDEVILEELTPLEEDLKYFQGLSEVIVKRLDFHKDYISVIMKVALAMNLEAEKAVDEKQLKAAVYLHCFGLASLPFEILDKNEELEGVDKHIYQQHPKKAFNFLSSIPGWGVAAQIVLQGCEHCDGTGFPLGIDRKSISDGAKIIAIARAFEQKLHSNLSNKASLRNLMSCILDLNNHADTEFCTHWLNIFNVAVKTLKEDLLE